MIRHLLVIMPLVVAAGAAFAHSWYDQSCCSESDCQPIKLIKIDRGVIYVWKSWRRPDVTLSIAFDDPRVKDSLDHEYHACETFTGMKENPIRVRCFYRPRAGV